MGASDGSRGSGATSGAQLILYTLATGQFLMTLDMSVMNVSIATVAEDVGTTVTGIQTAITLYTLVMATLMITGSKIGAMIGHKRAFVIGAVIYGLGSFTTALAPNLPVLILGWSFLEGVGAALILPAIVALVAGNFPPPERPRAYGIIAAAAAIAVAIGPLIGGLATTYFSWRWVFVGEDLVVVAIIVLSRRIADPEPPPRTRLDVVGAALSAVGLGCIVFGVLRSGEWGWVQPTVGGPQVLGLSPVIWLEVGGLFVMWLFVRWQERLESRGDEPLVRTELLRNRQLGGGLRMFFFQFMIQAGAFFIVPLFLSVVLGLSAIETGKQLVPLSVTLLIAAVGVPRVFPRANPRRVVRAGLVVMIAGIAVMMGGLEPGSDSSLVFVPMLLMGLGMGMLASQLGAVTVSSVPDDQSSEVGGLQNTVTNLGASFGTALAGAILISSLTTAFIQGVQRNPDVPPRIASQAEVSLAGGIPFISDAELTSKLEDAGLSATATAAIVDENERAQFVGLRAALGILAIAGLLALLASGPLPTTPPGAEREEEAAAPQGP